MGQKSEFDNPNRQSEMIDESGTSQFYCSCMDSHYFDELELLFFVSPKVVENIWFPELLY